MAQIAEVSIAAASAPVGTNLLADSIYGQSRVARQIRGVALKGSAAAGDTIVAILVDTMEIGRIFNSGTGFPNRDDIKPLVANVPAGAQLFANIVDAPATNPINLLMAFA